MSRSLSVGVVFALLLCSPGCVGPRFAKCPTQGGRPWLELESEHFTLRTDLPREKAYELSYSLERTRAAMLRAAWPEASSLRMVPVTVYALGTAEDFHRLYPETTEAFFKRRGNTPFIVLHAPRTALLPFGPQAAVSSDTVEHELAHYLSSYFLLRQPRWLSEGLAGFMETMELSEDGRSVILGRPDREAALSMMTLLRERRRSAAAGSWPSCGNPIRTRPSAAVSRCSGRSIRTSPTAGVPSRCTP